MAFAFVLATVVVEGRKSGEGSDLLAADAAELRHPDDERHGRPLADARNAEDEIEAAGEVIVIAQGLDDAPLLGGAAGLQPGDVANDDALQPWVVDVLKPDLETGDVLLDL